MKKFKGIVVGVLLTLLFPYSVNTTENKILFKVDNEIITSIDILTELRYIKSINAQLKNTDKKRAFEIAKRSLIREKIKEIELKKKIKSIKLEDQFLNNILINYFSHIQIKSIIGFEKYFTSINIDPNLIKKKITIEVLWNELIFSKYNQNVIIDKNAIILDLKRNDKQKEFFLSEILFQINSDEKLKEKYELIKNTIQDTNFSEAALTYSISDTSKKGGELGWIKDTSISSTIKSSLKNINIGEYTNPITIPGGFLILKVVDIRKTNNVLNLDDKVQNIIKEKTNEQLNQFSNIYFNKIQKNITINEL